MQAVNEPYARKMSSILILMIFFNIQSTNYAINFRINHIIIQNLVESLVVFGGQFWKFFFGKGPF